MRLATRNKIKQNTIAFSFLAVPLLLLGIFVFYPLTYGIYISFMKFEILKKPVVGGLGQFISQFITNLEYLAHPILSSFILVFSIVALFTVLTKREFSRKLMVLFISLLLISNIIPTASIINKTLSEINYVISEDRVLKDTMAEKYTKVLEKKYEGEETIQIIREKESEGTTRIIVKESIWLGLGHYKRILKNKEFADFVKDNNWYKLLLVLPLFGLVGILIISRDKASYSRKVEISVKAATLVIIAILISITWPRIFHERVWLSYQGLENSLKYLLVVPPIQIASILLAVLVNQKIKGIRLFRTLYYVPVITGVIIIGYCWKWIFNPDGLLNFLLQMVHILERGEKIYWLSEPTIALWVVMFVTFWRGLGYYMVIYMAGLQNIPVDLVEAATIDGASKTQLIARIYLPLLRPIILICSVLSTMAALKIFEEIYVMTSDTLNNTIIPTMVFLIYKKAFGGTEFKFGYSSALAVILSLIIGVFTILNFKLNRGEGVDA